MTWANGALSARNQYGQYTPIGEGDSDIVADAGGGGFAVRETVLPDSGRARPNPAFASRIEGGPDFKDTQAPIDLGERGDLEITETRHLPPRPFSWYLPTQAAPVETFVPYAAQPWDRAPADPRKLPNMRPVEAITEINPVPMLPVPELTVRRKLGPSPFAQQDEAPGVLGKGGNDAAILVGVLAAIGAALWLARA